MSIKQKIATAVTKINTNVHHFPKNCSIDIRSKLSNTVCEGLNKVLKGTELIDCKIGLASFIGCNCSLVNTEIGRYCSIGGDVKLIYGNHPVNKIVSTYPAFYSANAQYGFTYVDNNIFEEFSTLRSGRFLEIGNDVWIGSSVKILGGVRIGDGAVIGANSFVNRDVEPYSVVVGIPAKVKRMRFTEDQINKLLEIKWWEKDDRWLSEHAFLFSDIERFIDELF